MWQYPGAHRYLRHYPTATCSLDEVQMHQTRVKSRAHPQNMCNVVDVLKQLIHVVCKQISMPGAASPFVHLQLMPVLRTDAGALQPHSVQAAPTPSIRYLPPIMQ
eukprot:GHUV01012607.1.p1 GENE.GHUV01012607.1~~GHUV01012607.1.p1  ORF type:complete len:105 (-),score=7.23 GHUV01012607.1:950-1264(-)